MMRILLPATILLGACVTMDNTKVQDVVLLTGSVKSIQYDREASTDGDEVIVGAWFKAQLDGVKPLIGQLEASSVEVDLTMTSAPREYRNREMYVLLKGTPDGKLQALTWDYVEGGLCIPREMAKAYLIEDDLKRLRQSNAVKWDSGCDW